jgi:hypothetical protein
MALRRSFAAPFLEQIVKKLLIAVLVAAALPALARPPVERPVQHRMVGVEKANERQKEAAAAVIKEKMIEKTKINEH